MNKKQYRSRGQADLVGAMILISATLIVGIGFLALLYPNVSGLVEQNELRTLLYNEQSLLTLYREYENSTHICIGFLRLEPTKVLYAVAYIVGDNVDNNSISLPQLTNGTYLVTRYYPKTNCMVNGEYYPCPYRINNVVYIPDKIVEDYLMKNIPGLLCVNRTNQTARLIFFITVNQDLYEVGRVEINA